MTGTNSTTNQAARRYGPWAVGAGATLLSVIFFLSIGLGATAVIRGATGSWEGLPLMVRLGLAGLAVGVSCTLAYRICQTESNKFMTVRHKRGDLAATFGVLVGMG